MYFFVVIVYAICLCHLFIYEGPRLPAIFVGLWVLGFLGTGWLGPGSGFVFIAYQALLCVVMQFVLKFRNPDYRH